MAVFAEISDLTSEQRTADALAIYVRSETPMPPRSKVIAIVPAYIRPEAERRRFENGFRDYEDLALGVPAKGGNLRRGAALYPRRTSNAPRRR